MNRTIRNFAALLLAFALFWSGSQAQDSLDIKAYYTKAEHMIPMRDGVKLFTIVYTPKDTSQKYPILLHRTPYSSPPYGLDAYRSALGPSRDFAKEGYIFVYQDVRGKFKSEGDFVVMRPIKPDKKKNTDTDESSDTYDTIEWLLKNIPNNNGRVGQWGISYPGCQTVWGMIDAHPALKASSPQAPAIDMFIGDDFHHNGAFRLMYTFSWLSGSARTRTTPTEGRDQPFNYGTPDGYRFFLNAGSLSNINEEYFQGRVPTWNEYMDHPNYDDYWQRQNPVRYLKNIRQAILNVGGWFDAEDFFGPLETYRTIEKLNPSNKSVIVIGPWRHGGWASMPGDSLGDIRFGSKTGEYFRQNVELPFFNYYLKDKGALKLTEALVFETGANEWKQFDSWPPQGTETKKLYFQPNGRLSFNPPSETLAEGFDSYVSDPAKPVPFSSEIRTTQGSLWMVEDQRFAATRPDVLVYESDILETDVTIVGPITASLFCSSTGTDTDWVVKLIDVYPGDAPDNTPNPKAVRMGNFQMLLAGEVFRSKYRNSYSNPEPLVPDQPTKIEFSLRDRFHRFLKGHRIMVQIQSSWFPVIDRNPQKFIDIYKAKESDFQKATNRVYRSGNLLSSVIVNVIK
ncbi:MAG: CocE/NonD family hydrolase [Candidatus Aminicenantes bacterium]|nr:CocE/NonD family hydrolase [Candidatus Aminicenantes bacterium]